MSFLWLWQRGGWDVDRWKKSQTWKPIYSEQSNHKELLPIGNWPAVRDRWTVVSEQLLGKLNDKPPAKMRWEFLGEPIQRQSIVMRRLRFTLTDHEWGYAWLLTPGDDRKIRPAVIALHQTVVQGKNEPVGLEGQPEFLTGMDYAWRAAQEGFAVLAPDAIGFGERAGEHSNAFYRSVDQFFAAHPEGSVMGKMVYDVSRAVDLLQQFPEIDPKRIGCIGHSHGGYGTLFALIGEPRLAAGVISCGFNTIRADPNPERWWRRTCILPRLAFYEGHIEQIPIDVHLWLALISPRPLFISAGLNDAIFPKTDDLPRVMEMLKPIWTAGGAGEALQSRIYPGPHDFPAESRDEAFKFLKRFLGT